ncbi:hypothetical protein TNCV_1182641 [Trichonephila clavipes]|nr:hypothetical protein TNCV_1182641 [Trichonephila clavipes]
MQSIDRLKIFTRIVLQNNSFEGRRIRSDYLYRPQQNGCLRVMFGTSLYRYHTATYPHAVIRRIGERAIPYSCQIGLSCIIGRIRCIDNDNACTKSIKVGKGILESAQSFKSIINGDSEEEIKVTNAAHVSRKLGTS